MRVGTQSRMWGQRGWTQRRPAPESSAGHRLTFASVLFEGVLEVTDAERFRQALEQGIGSAKAYGFGLLSIAPASARTALAGAARA